MFQTIAFLVLAAHSFWNLVYAREFNNTGKGLIALEEAWITEELVNTTGNGAPPAGETIGDLVSDLLDIHNQRLQRMDAAGIDFAVISAAEPAVQNVFVPSDAEALATRTNDALASLIANNTMRFGGFAALSMHNASQAAAELKRVVQTYGFLGALLNDYQVTGSDTAPTFLYYDASAYDIFWQAVVDLDVPVYFHPRNPVPSQQALQYTNATWLIAPAHQFEIDLSTHIMRLITNGVFDRFPSLKIIVGHMGERIPSDLWRIDHELVRQIPRGLPMKKQVADYFGTNIFTTTSGEFATQLLYFHIATIGSGTIMFSVDYPYENMQNGSDWFNSLQLRDSDRALIARQTAINVLGLNK